MQQLGLVFACSVYYSADCYIQMSESILRYSTEIKSLRQPLLFDTVIGIVQEATSELGFRSNNVLAALDTELTLSMTRLATNLAATLDPANDHTGQQISRLDPIVPDVHLAVNYLTPWSERVAQIATSNAVNVQAEEKAVKMNEEMKELVRVMRTKVSFTLQDWSVCSSGLF